MVIIGLMIMFPAIMIPFYPGESGYAMAFLIPGAGIVVIGLLFSLFIFRKRKGKLRGADDIIITLNVWLLAIVLGAAPFVLIGKMGQPATYLNTAGQEITVQTYDFTQAMFETTSGLTTTGDTIVDVANAPHIVLFYRAVLQLVGGAGLILILTSAMNSRSGLNLFNLEGHSDLFFPNLRRTARIILIIYLSYVTIGFVLYVGFGMPPFDAICDAITAVATGGFSTTADSIGQFDSVPIEVISEILMVLGATNFMLPFLFFRPNIDIKRDKEGRIVYDRKGRVRHTLNIRKNLTVIHHFEFLALIPMAILYFFIIKGMTEVYSGDLAMGFRKGTFEFISAYSTCGFTSSSPTTAFTGYKIGVANVVPTYAYVAIALLTMIGGQAGSTSGGIKHQRISYAILNLYWILKAKCTGERVVTARHYYRFGEEQDANDDEINEAMVFILLYISLLILGTGVLCCFTDTDGTHYLLQDAFFEFASCIGTTGLSCGIMNYGAVPGVLWTGIIGMFLARLEFFIFIIYPVRIAQVIRKHKHVYDGTVIDN
jgi:trk system potassium uptake protein TrkH